MVSDQIDINWAVQLVQLQKPLEAGHFGRGAVLLVYRKQRADHLLSYLVFLVNFTDIDEYCLVGRMKAKSLKENLP